MQAGIQGSEARTPVLITEKPLKMTISLFVGKFTSHIIENVPHPPFSEVLDPAWTFAYSKTRYIFAYTHLKIDFVKITGAPERMSMNCRRFRC